MPIQSSRKRAGSFTLQVPRCPKCLGRETHFDKRCPANWPRAAFAVITAFIIYPLGSFWYRCRDCGACFLAPADNSDV